MVALAAFNVGNRARLTSRQCPYLTADTCSLLLLSLAHERAKTTVSRNLGVALCKRSFACRADLGRLPACRRVRALSAGARRGRGLRLRHRRARSADHP